MRDNNITELKADKKLHSQWVKMVIVGFVLGIIAYNIEVDENFRLILACCAGLIVFYGLVLSKEKIFIKIDRNDFIIERQLFNNYKIKRFNIKKIENLSYRVNVKSNSYTSSGYVKVLGIDTTPESWKKYYYHKEILSFNNDGKYIEIGKWKKAFGAKEWTKRIEELK